MYQAYRVVSPSCFDVRPTVISCKDGGGQLRPVCRRLLFRRNGCSQGRRFETGIFLGVVRDRERVVIVVRALDVIWPTVCRILLGEMLRVTVLMVCVVRVAGVAVIGRTRIGVLSG
jgi:hypothetical protein